MDLEYVKVRVCMLVWVCEVSVGERNQCECVMVDIQHDQSIVWGHTWVKCEMLALH